MTEIIKSFKTVGENSDTVFIFENNKNIKSIKFLLVGKWCECTGKEITIKYALNGITSDLIFLKKQQIESEIFEVECDTPICASHIYISRPDENITFFNVEFTEEISNKENNYYPAYFDTDLKENYYLDSVAVFTTEKGYSNYSVFTSKDGVNFEFLASKQDDNICDFSTGDIYSANGKEARIIRVYIEYNSSSDQALFDHIEFNGKLSNTPIKKAKEINIPEFKDSEYNINLTTQDTLDEIYNIIERRIGEEYKKWFIFEIAESEAYDYFFLSDNDGKILIKGNSGVSLCMGLNHYLKYYCKVNISQVGDQTAMPKNIIKLNCTVYKETKAKIRYAYNYCTLSYSMAFWGEEEWQNELDWLALNGVNVVLDATAQEEVWRRFLTEIGYTHEEIKKFIAGPAYYAWAYMANLSGFGGPVHDNWFYERTALARKNHLRMRKLGIYPVLQGYSGMVPNDIDKHIPNIDIIPQGTWCSFQRPTMLRTTSPIFREFAQKFYKAQCEVYGDYSIYFATDPFHEGGNVSDMKPSEISKEVLSAMLKHNENAVWIIQSWQNNPSSELLRGITEIPDGKNHALILDLYAEKQPNYKNGCEGNPNHGYSPEFDSTPWVFCMLNNFGGRLGLHGHIDNLNNWIPDAFNNCSAIKGIGITPEASFNNPILYDFLFESVWRDNAESEMQPINLTEWTKSYTERRYGAKSEATLKAFEILLNTVYKAELNNLGQGAPESVINARPSLEINAASTWGNAIISYDKNSLKEALKFLLADYDKMKNSKGYRYDLITLLQQILSNAAGDIYMDLVNAFKIKDLNQFKTFADKFLKIADLMDEVLSGNEYYMLGRWVESAKKLAQSTDDFTKKLYTFNAKALITTWGSYNQCETGGLKDYSNRQWSGLIKDFYKPRWERFITARINELEGKPFEEKIDWFVYEWQWARNNCSYSFVPENVDLKTTSQKILDI